MTKNYDKKIVIKPWGYEYNIFRNKKKLAITYLKILKGKSTSLHCHPIKKTGFLILSGIAEVQIGIYKENIIKYSPLSILVLRPGLFHRIKASKYSNLYALEIETPYLKSDLIRMKDSYGRQNKGYEGLQSTKKISKTDIIFKLPKKKQFNKYLLNKVSIDLRYYKNFNSFKNFDDNSISIICDGEIVSKNGKQVISTGEIVKSFTLKKLSNFFKIKKDILVLKAKK